MRCMVQTTWKSFTVAAARTGVFALAVLPSASLANPPRLQPGRGLRHASATTRKTGVTASPRIVSFGTSLNFHNAVGPQTACDLASAGTKHDLFELPDSDDTDASNDTEQNGWSPKALRGARIATPKGQWQLTAARCSTISKAPLAVTDLPLARGPPELPLAQRSIVARRSLLENPQPQG